MIMRNQARSEIPNLREFHIGLETNLLDQDFFRLNLDSVGCTGIARFSGRISPSSAKVDNTNGVVKELLVSECGAHYFCRSVLRYSASSSEGVKVACLGETTTGEMGSKSLSFHNDTQFHVNEAKIVDDAANVRRKA